MVVVLVVWSCCLYVSGCDLLVWIWWYGCSEYWITGWVDFAVLVFGWLASGVFWYSSGGFDLRWVVIIEYFWACYLCSCMYVRLRVGFCVVMLCLGWGGLLSGCVLD